MDTASLESLIRTQAEPLQYAAFFGTLFILGLLEPFVARRAARADRRARWPANFGLTVLNVIPGPPIELVAMAADASVSRARHPAEPSQDGQSRIAWRADGIFGPHRMTVDIRKIDSLIREIRACFHRLGAAGDAIHKDKGVTAAMRGVMESLYEGGPQTVPQIAAVSRQHIQVLVNQLVAAGHVAPADNPAHKRSPFIALTEAGTRTFQDMRQTEKAILEQFAQCFRQDDLATTLDTLRRFTDRVGTFAKRQREDGSDP